MVNKIVKHYYNGCIGCGACSQLCPEFFKFNLETFKAELVDGVLPTGVDPDSPEAYLERPVANEGALPELEMVASACPAQIIKVAESEEEVAGSAPLEPSVSN